MLIRMGLYFAGLYLYLAIGALFGLSSFSYGARAYHYAGTSQTVYLFLGFAVCAHMMLVFPLTQWVYPVQGKVWSLAKRLTIISALVSLPLIGFGHYLGGATTAIDLFELALSVVPGVVAALLLYEHTKNPIVFSVALTTFVLPNFVIVGDLLSPFSLWFSYAANGPLFYLLRAFLPLAAMLCAVTWEVKRNSFEENTPLSGFAIAAIALLVYSLLTEIIFPVTMEGPGLHFTWISYSVMLVLLWRKNETAYYCALFLAGAQIGFAAYQFLAVLPTARVTFFALAHGVGQLCALFFFAALFSELIKAPRKRLFITGR